MLIMIESSNFSKFSYSKYYRQVLFHLVFFKLTTKLDCDMLIAKWIFTFSIFSALIFC